MNRNEAIAAAKAAGFTHVYTAAGWLRLQDWTPYGCTKDAPTWAARDFPRFKVVTAEGEQPRIEDVPVAQPATHQLRPEFTQNLGRWPLRKDSE